MINKDNNNDFLISFEQYKIAIDMADRVSSRRGGTNNFFLSANSIVFVFLTAQNNFYGIHIFVAIFGILLSFIWYFIILNYKNLNKIKYSIINEIEKDMPLEIYKKEWDRFKSLNENNKWFTRIEKYMPILFIWLYSIFLLFVLFKLYGKYICMEILI